MFHSTFIRMYVSFQRCLNFRAKRKGKVGHCANTSYSLSDNPDCISKTTGECEIRRAMTGPAWGSRFCLVLAAITIVIANYPRHRDRHLREQLVNSHKVTRNITQLQGALHSDTIHSLPSIRMPQLFFHTYRRASLKQNVADELLYFSQCFPLRAPRM